MVRALLTDRHARSDDGADPSQAESGFGQIAMLSESFAVSAYRRNGVAGSLGLLMSSNLASMAPISAWLW